ncbi:Protein N-acetyltransferase, RimJ/RimL family [Shimia gijangensis]|uniref:Protein N-acetyltransferase, RimJ/RimL family n=1 Tax=Shimia gijangensis TaxID=1470563 RepID=A0A1M6S7L7_9RHOB|nr:GNAT family N-acetyltransferase [Shimia gijangensis]SHK40784.1 Protein N-acetyltransferase, RimJ/RimL family [Shimia gijangensis]
MKHDTIVNQPVIETERFVMRPLRRSDEGLIEMYAGDATVARMTSSIPHPLPPGSVDAYVTRAQSDERIEDVWALDASADGGSELMGIIGLKRVDFGKVEIGYWVAPAFWNTGLASEAVRSLIDANPLASDTLYAAVFQDNPASARVLTNCGFQYLGDAESFSVARNAAVPTWTYSLKLD